jgi:ATP-dependent Clp protease ATP-binding subunit ClpA
MFEKFTERGRQVVVVAHEEARGLQHNYIGTEHILLGLLGVEEGLAARSLRSLGLTIERVRGEVVRIVGTGAEASEGQIPFTPRAKKVLEQSLRESQMTGHHQIGTEDILLALIREDGVAARILLDYDADPGTVRDEVMRLLSGPGAPRRSLTAGVVETWSEGLNTHLDHLGREIQRELDRDPDSGDLLLALACTQETLAGQALTQLGVALDALQAAIEQARGERGQATDEIDRRAEEVRQAKEQAVEAGDHEQAALLRDRERELFAQPGAARILGSAALDEFRRRIGLTEDP